MTTKTYDTIIDLLTMEGPGLQDHLHGTDRLQQLIDGTLAPGVIADEYLDELAFSEETGHCKVTTSPEKTRADLLDWIRNEIDIAIQQRKQTARDDAMCAALDDIAAITAAEKRALDKSHEDKIALIAEAQRHGASKGAIANALGISRPTLDKWLAEKEDRALFDRAAFELIRAEIPSDVEASLTAIIAIRDTAHQAKTLITALSQCEPVTLSERARAIVDQAATRAAEVQ